MTNAAATAMSPPAATAVAFVGLGTNLGDGVATLQGALHALAAQPGILQCQASPFYSCAPVEASGPDYTNAVARLRTTLAPSGLLDALQALELQYGRERPYRNAPRTLDLDLLLYGELKLDTPRLTVPHPRMHRRAFVLMPLRDLAPELRLNGEPLQQLLERCAEQRISRLPAQ